eukprot:189033-Pelagomonas_calceolata.AAC.1
MMSNTYDKSNSNTRKPNLISIGLVVKQPGHHGEQGLQAVGAHSPEVQVREARLGMPSRSTAVAEDEEMEGCERCKWLTVHGADAT